MQETTHKLGSPCLRCQINVTIISMQIIEYLIMFLTTKIENKIFINFVN